MTYNDILKQAIKFHQAGNFDDAESLYRQILQTNPENCQIINLLGLVAQSKGMHKEAVEIFSKNILKNPKIAEYYFNFAWSLQECGKFSEAISAFQKALLCDANLKEAHNAIGRCWLGLENKNKALAAFEKALTFDANYIEAQINIANINNDTLALEELAKRLPSNGEVLYHLGVLYRKNGQLANALEAVLQADALLDDENIKLLAAELFLQKQDHQQARYFFEQVLERNHKSVNALINLGNMQNCDATAEQMYQKALDIEPHNFDARLNYANFLYNTNRKVEALGEYQQAAIINPKSAELCNNLGIIQRDIGEYEEAIGLFMSAFFQSVEQNQYAINIAESLVLLHKSKPELALDIAQNWQAHAPQNAVAKHCLSSLKGENVANPAEYSRILFDNFSSSFEATMRDLDYNLPQLISQELGDLSGKIVDLGCGSGLIGEKIKRDGNQLIGVDISSNILTLTKQKNIYHELVCADIMEYMLNKPNADWFIAADVMGYIGDFKKLVAMVYPSNFCFSVAIDKNSDTFSLHPNGRFAHNPSFVRKILKDIGYKKIDEKHMVIRYEDKHPVEGVLFVAKKE